jgi:phosphoglycolate phosphatase
MPLKALIFDLDGTLIDSAPDLRTATNKVLTSYQRRSLSLSEVKSFVGNGASKLIERAFCATGEAADPMDLPKLTAEFLAFYEGHEADKTLLYDGVMEILCILKDKGYRLALCTNKPQIPSEHILRDFGLKDLFEVVIGGDQLPTKKPNPEMIHWVLNQMELSADEAIMIGDTINDINGAKNAKMRNVAVSFGYNKGKIEELGADVVIDEFKELLDVL